MARAADKNYYVGVGARIKSQRIAVGLTQAELARQLQVSQQAIFAYELGDRRVSVGLLTPLATCLKCTTDYIIGNSAAPPSRRKSKLSARVVRLAENIEELPQTRKRLLARIVELLQAEAATIRG